MARKKGWTGRAPLWPPEEKMFDGVKFQRVATFAPGMEKKVEESKANFRRWGVLCRVVKKDNRHFLYVAKKAPGRGR